MNYKNGDIYKGEWKNDLKEGKGIMKYNNGDIYKGEWKNDLKEGKGIMEYNNGFFHDGNWLDDKKIGLNYKLRVLYYGKNVSNILNKTSIKSSWENYIFEGELNSKRNNAIKNLLERDCESKDFYDILIITVDKLLNENTKSVFTFFQRLNEIILNPQPFILFLTKNEENPKIKELHKFITNEYYDKRNLYAFKENETEKINKVLLKSMNYYHEKEKLKYWNSLKIPISFNILICGVRKNNFLSQFLEVKQIKNSDKIQKYLHPRYPIVIFNSPGFENENNKTLFINEIKKSYNNKFPHYHFNLILYYTKLSELDENPFDLELIKYFIQTNKKVIFVLNSNGLQKNEADILYNKSKDSISESMKVKNDELTFILVEQKESIDSGKIYGMNVLFNKIFEMFEKKKINVKDFNKCHSIEDYLKNIKKYELLNDLKNILDLKANLTYDISNTILSYSNYDYYMIFLRQNRRKYLLEEIIKKFNVIEDNDIILKNNKNFINDLLSELEYSIREEDVDKLKETFFKKIKRLQAFGKKEISLNRNYNEYTLLIGIFVMEMFINFYFKNIGLYDEDTKILIEKLSNELNKSIDSFISLSKDWKNIYKEIDSRTTEKEYVKICS